MLLMARLEVEYPSRQAKKGPSPIILATLKMLGENEVHAARMEWSQ